MWKMIQQLINGGQLKYFDLLFNLQEGDNRLDVDCVDNAIDNLTFSEIEF